MGLDMYLCEKRNLSHYKSLKEYSDRYCKEFALAEKVLTDIGLKTTVDGVVTVTAEVMYWRKTNAIHGWFVKNIQRQHDNCREYELEGEALRRLVATCEQVLANPDLAEELLPVQDGFFFGSTKYDKWYFKSLEDTVEGVNRALELANPESYFTYQSSW
jgi:hypothetical protein